MKLGDDVSSTMQLHFCREYNTGAGEDAEPILLTTHDETGLIAVFDGMGGSGSTIYLSQDGASHTGAYYASRLVRESVENFFHSIIFRQDYTKPIEIDVNALKEKISINLKAKLSELDSSRSTALKNKLIRSLPTTMTSLCFYKSIVADTYFCRAIWAGDSRGYVLKTDHGLQQLTDDDVKYKSDALKSLIDDSPLSNFINADKDFTLNYRVLEFKSPIIILVATDGCFGYLPTPIHFEHLLLETLFQSENADEWNDKLVENLKHIAGDDISLALVALGWNNFAELKRAFLARTNQIRVYIEPVIDAIDQFITAEEKFKPYKVTRQRYALKKQNVIEQLWLTYKEHYEEYSHSPKTTF